MNNVLFICVLYVKCRAFFSESFNTNLSASCVCPPACDVKHYTSAMSYATANDDTRPQQSVSAEFLKRAGKHLNESIDTKENMLPERRQANEEEASRKLG